MFADNKSVKRVAFEECTEENPNVLTEMAVKQLAEYFRGERSEFSLPLEPDGTEFQKKVWRKLSEVTYGRVSTYKEIAEETGRSHAWRAVGNANANNPIVIMIPGHRIISSDGSLGGYSCGIDRKKYLLDLEKRHTGTEMRP